MVILHTWQHNILVNTLNILRRATEKKLFDGLCFKSSLDNEGLNYVLFDISETKKYKINNSSIYQMMDLTGKLQQQLPLSNEM